MNNIWILVADSSRAKIYEADLTLENVAEVHDMVHSEARLQARELISDLPGRNVSARSGSHHNFSPQTSTHQQEVQAFAKEVVQVLDAGRNKQAFTKLALVAAPDFLGHIRNGMPPPLRKMVVHEVDKNVVKQPVPALRKLLPRTFYSNLE